MISLPSDEYASVSQIRVLSGCDLHAAVTRIAADFRVTVVKVELYETVLRKVDDFVSGMPLFHCKERFFSYSCTAFGAYVGFASFFSYSFYRTSCRVAMSSFSGCELL